MTSQQDRREAQLVAEIELLTQMRFTIKYELESRGHNQKWLARQMGVHQSTVSRLLSGDNDPQLRLVLRAFQALGLDVKLSTRKRRH